MVNFRLCLLTLSLITLTFFALRPSHAMSGETLIIDVCGQTPGPNLCQTCLHSDPRSKVADIKTLAMISVACGKRDAYKLYDDAWNLYNSTSSETNPGLKNLLNDCYSRFHLAGDYIDSAGWILQNRGVDLARQVVSDSGPAMAPMAYCSDLFKKNPGVAVPKNIIDEMNVVVTDIHIVLGIMNRIVRQY